MYSEARQERGRRTVDKQVHTQSAAELQAFKRLCRTAFACSADARKALATFKLGLLATRVEGETIRAVTRYGRRGRPAPEAAPQRVEYRIEGALASSLAFHQTPREAKSCFILATNELATTALPAPAVVAGYKKQSMAERGFRFRKDPQFLAASLYLQKPERIMALRMVMTVCLLVYAALEYRIRQALQRQQATFPAQKGRQLSTPTARWVFYAFVGIHVLIGAAPEPLVLNLHAEHQLVLRLLGTAYEALYS